MERIELIFTSCFIFFAMEAVWKRVLLMIHFCEKFFTRIEETSAEDGGREREGYDKAYPCTRRAHGRYYIVGVDEYAREREAD